MKPESTYFLQPTDAWFFRDGRPFNRGEDYQVAGNLFPPHAPTVGGSLRASMAHSLGWDGRKWAAELKQKLGSHEDLGPLRLTGPFLARELDIGEHELLFPMPQHVLGTVSVANDGRQRFVAQSWLVPSDQPIETDLGLVHLPVSTQRASASVRHQPADSFWLTSSGLTRVLAGQLPGPEECVHEGDLFRFEQRTGIARDFGSRTVSTGDLYSPRYVRLAHGVGVAVGVDGAVDGLAPASIFPLGGESRMATCESIQANFPWAGESVDKRQILIALTACRFGNETNQKWYGAGPGDAASALHPRLTGKVTTTALDRPTHIGGWKTDDQGRGQPTAMRPHVPAGSVWWLSESISERQVELGDSTAWGFGTTVSAVVSST